MNIYFLRQSFENIRQMLLKKINDNSVHFYFIFMQNSS